MRRQLPLMIVFITGVVMAIRFFIPAEISGNLKDYMNDWLIIIGILPQQLRSVL